MTAGKEGKQPPAGGEVTAEDSSNQLLAAGRGCAGTAVTGGCGCGAFLVGAVLAVALFAPQLMAGWSSRLLQRQIGAQIQGDVSIDGMTLSWTEQQRADSITISDDAGNLVLQAGCECPPCWSSRTRRGGIRVRLLRPAPQGVHRSRRLEQSGADLRSHGGSGRRRRSGADALGGRLLHIGALPGRGRP